MPWYEVTLYASDVVTVQANNRDEAVSLALEHHDEYECYDDEVVELTTNTDLLNSQQTTRQIIRQGAIA